MRSAQSNVIIVNYVRAQEVVPRMIYDPTKGAGRIVRCGLSVTSERGCCHFELWRVDAHRKHWEGSRFIVLLRDRYQCQWNEARVVSDQEWERQRPSADERNPRQKK